MMQRWRHLRKIAIRGQNWFQTNLCGEWNFVANETLRLNRIQKMHVKRFFYFTCVFFCACAFVLDTTPSIGQTSKTDSAGSQTTEDSNRLRFKYEKRGAIVYAQGDDYELKCDLFVPESDSPRPIMLAIHGGAWTTGSKFAMTRHARILANRGYVVMAINYRHKWPAQIHDCKHAVRWIREHASEYNADPKRVFAFGYSAGAHLATMLATTDADDGLEGDDTEPYLKHDTRIQGVIAGGTPTDFTVIDGESSMLSYWLGKTRNAAPEVYRTASPVTFVTDDDPVAVLFHGKSDAIVPVLSATTFIEKYEQTGIGSALNLAAGGHGATFSQTSLLIESLQQLESLVAKTDTNDRMLKIMKWYAAFQTANDRSPRSRTELTEFLSANQQSDPSADLLIFRGLRDGQQFLVDWNAALDSTESIIKEAIGENGRKLIGTLPDQIIETDDKTHDKATQMAEPGR